MRLLLLALLVIAPWAHAQTVDDLYTETSMQGETLDAFVLRIAPRAAAYTDETNTEVCGHFQQSEEGMFGIHVCTTHLPLDCQIWVQETPTWKALYTTFHTHTKIGGIAFSSGDWDEGIDGYLIAGTTIKKKVSVRVTRVQTDKNPVY